MPLRKKVWEKIAGEWKPQNLEKIVTECTLDQIDNEIDTILNGGQTGRVLINLQ